MIVIWITQQQTPTLVGTMLFYQSRGSDFDSADNTELVMMFSEKNPLWSDCGPSLLVLFRCINFTTEWSGLLLPLISIQIIFQSISPKFPKNKNGCRKFSYLFQNGLNLLFKRSGVSDQNAGRHQCRQGDKTPPCCFEKNWSLLFIQDFFGITFFFFFSRKQGHTHMHTLSHSHTFTHTLMSAEKPH